MADTPVDIGVGSREHVAYKLLVHIAQAEKKKMAGPDANVARDWILSTYAQCLRTVNAPHNVKDYLADVG